MIDYLESFKDWYDRVDGEALEIATIEEQWDINAVPNKRNKPIEVFLGRMQPIHLGHIKIIKKMKNPIVILVKGAKSSLDKNRNPLSAEVQTLLLRKAVPGIKVIIARNGYLPEIFTDLRETGHYEVNKLYAGADRIKGYKGQIDSVNKKLDDQKQFEIEYVETERFTSATKVREIIRNGDFEGFKKLMPKQLHSEFEMLRGLIK